ncbi:monoacylglycerol lipase ABHD6 [Aplysia californica]|uniref:acylglycerol lipase n=1 Tax=Aplysia californica TaxID=6500 RepID=A0ABM0JVV8_APLCA|nr:monoacylglycerol lipase ABHD6 [Aplysia californica]
MDLVDLVYPELTLMNPAALTVVTVTAMMSLYVYFMQPSMILQAYFRVAVRWSGMKIRCTKLLPDGFRFFYGEKGQKTKGQMSVVFLHGFTADHFMWAPIVQNIPSSIHVIAVDLPGHGFTMDPLDNDDIGFRAQVTRIKQFLDLIDLTEPVHLVGISMGGALAGLFAAEFPDLVGALSLTCPSMKTPEESHMIKSNKERVLQAGELTIENCPMLPQTSRQVQEMLNISHYFSVSYPSQILKGVAELRKRKNDFYLRLVREIISEPSQVMLESSLSKISSPTQVIWGQEDWIVDVSGVDVLRKHLPNCRRVNIMPKCGHAVNLDQPAQFAQIVLDFWRDQQSRMLPEGKKCS